MIAPDALLELYRRHREDTVLSVYVNADQHDFAERDAWRVNLRHGLDAAAERIADADHAERERFAAARRLVEEAATAAAEPSFLPGRGWVAFATGERILHGERLDVPTPNQVRWDTGLRIGQYARAFKQMRPLLLVILDRREATVHRYLGSRLERLEHLHADTWLGDLEEIEVSKRPATHTGTRGETGTDAAKALLDNAAHQLVSRIIAELEEAGDNAPVVLGGTDRQVAALRRALPEAFAERAHHEPAFHGDMNPAELVKQMSATASRLSDARQERLLSELVELGHAEGDACLGPDPTLRALREQRVRRLLVSAGLQRRDPDLVDRLVGEALADNGADVDLLAREAGARLDEVAQGVAARLHYRIPRPDQPTG